MNGKMDEGAVYVNVARCTGCGACVDVCPAGAIHLVEDEAGRCAEIDQEVCRRCAACVEACPEQAIMPQFEPVIEGELVPRGDRSVPLEPQHREARLLRPVPKALTWLGTALVFAAREIVPRVAVSLLDAWDRRASQVAPYPNDVRPMRSAQRSLTNLSQRGGGPHRHRRHGG
jgi:ferredoxin